MTTELKRCAWAMGDPLMQAYHDTEWGVPERNGRVLWGKLMLDGFQAGLSWMTILRKREAFRKAFRDFDPEVVARFGAADVNRLLSDAGIIRSRAKITSTIAGARAYLEMTRSGEDFSALCWSSVGGKTLKSTRRSMRDIPAKTPQSEQLSKELKKRGFKFVGPVIVYAFMQATGMVNDHTVDCFRRTAVYR
jgi:DNA-3-methyladenine glycosylase I